jgi:hypothetical protein
MPAGDIYECVYDLTYGGQNIASVFHFVQIGTDGAGDPRTSVNLMFLNEFKTQYLFGLVDGLVGVGIRTRRIKPTETQALSASTTTAGNLAVPGLPPNQVGIMRTYGPILRAIPPLLGTRGIGRIMIPAIPEEDVEAGRLNVDQIGFRNNFADKLIDDQDDGSTSFLWHAAVYSRVDFVARKIEKAFMLAPIKNLCSRTRSA